MYRLALVTILALALGVFQPPRALAEAPTGGRETPFSLSPGIYVLDLVQGETRRLVSTEYSGAMLWINQTLAWSPGGARLATLPAIGKGVQVYEAASGRLQRDIPGQVSSIDWPFAEVIGATMRLSPGLEGEQGRGMINVSTGKVDGFLPGGSYPSTVSPDGLSVAYMRRGPPDERGLYRRDVASGDERRLLAGEPFGIFWSPDSTRIATSSYLDGGNSSILILDGESGEERARLAGWSAVVSWSPDGAWLATAASEKSAQESDHTELTARVYASDGSSSRRIGTGTLGTWSPDAKSLAFVRDGQIWLYSMTDGQVTPLLRPQMPVIEEIRWSPNGRMIAFRTGDSSGIYVAKPDGTQERYLAPGFGPNWSPKGDRLAFIYGAGALGFAGAVYTMTPQGTAINRLGRIFQGDVPTGCAFGIGFRWSTDGSSLAIWTRGTSSRLQLTVTADDPAPQSPREYGVVSEAAWSPDGSRIAYTELSPPREGLPSQVFACRVSISDANGANRVTLTDGAHRPVWSPDGRWLAVELINGPFGYGDATRVVASDGGGARAELRGRSPAWSPDGSELAMLRPTTPPGVIPTPHSASQLVVSNFDGSNERIVATASIRDFDWSPDGTRIVYGVSTQVETSINVVDLESGVSKRVGKGSSPAWSPDGQWDRFRTVDGAWLSRQSGEPSIVGESNR